MHFAESRRLIGCMAVSILAGKIDQLGKLAEEIEPFKPKLKEYDDLRKKIVAAFADRPADEVIVESGKVFEVEISAREEERVVNLAKLSRKLGPKKFFSVVTVPMKLLDQYVSAEDQKDMVTKERTGSRRVTVKRRGHKEAA